MRVDLHYPAGDARLGIHPVGGVLVKLYLQRHCEAEPGPRYDNHRELTPEGRKDADAMGAFLARHIGTVDLIISSPFHRTVDTAMTEALHLGCKLVIQNSFLDPDALPEQALDAIEAGAPANKHILVVSHHPLVNSLLELVCGAKTDDMHWEHGAIAHINDGRLHWFVSPAIVDDSSATEALDAAADAVNEAARIAEGWVTINGQHVDIGAGAEIASLKSILAAKHQVICDKAIQDIADKSEAKLSKAIGVPRTRDNSAFDLRNDEIGIEVKTVVTGKNDKITMSKRALGRKLAEAQAEKLKTFTVVADVRGGQTKYYVSNKLGSLRIGGMRQVTLSQLKDYVSQ